MNDEEKSKEQLINELAQAREEIGNIADRLANVLTGVLGNVDLARLYLERKEQRYKALENLLAVDALFPEVTELIQSLNSFSDEGTQDS